MMGDRFVKMYGVETCLKYNQFESYDLRRVSEQVKPAASGQD
jgi:hypothetical protein